MPTELDNLIGLLDLEQIEVNLFRGHSPQDRWQRVFGGQVIAQALIAATRLTDQAPSPRLVVRKLRRFTVGVSVETK